MPPSRLKSLKASLRSQGLIGPSKSKKEKKEGKQERTDRRIARSAALAEIREQYNPFEAKYLSRGPKYDSVSAQSSFNAVVGRPGAARAAGEEARRNTILKDMHRRQKVGGLVDRRFGEDDPSMTPEEKAMARFVRAKEREHRKSAMFNLEDEEDIEGLTHLGKSIFDDDGVQDDFEAGSLAGLEDDAEAESAARAQKRRRLEAHGEADDQQSADDQDDLPERPKTKQEVMKEVMAKSKLYKYERQQAKEDDDELRAKLDEGLHDIYAFLRKGPKQEKPPEPPRALEGPYMNPDRAAILNGTSRTDADKAYDARMRQMVFDSRSKPTEKTKTDEELAEIEAARLKDLEAQRLRRMAGDQDDAADEEAGVEDDVDDVDQSHILGRGIPVKKRDLDVEDEDEFLLDDDLIASDQSSENDSAEEASSSDADVPDEEDDLEFIADMLPEKTASRTEAEQGKVFRISNSASDSKDLAFTYPCPQSHPEFLEITKGVSPDDLHPLIQRIRALHSPKLAAENKGKLAKFAAVLIEHIPSLSTQEPRPSFSVIEALIRHIHSLAKSFPLEVAEAYRSQLNDMHKERPLNLNAGDLIVLTGIGSTFSTSDHFHQVATPAMMTMARYLGQKVPRSVSDLAKGLYVCSLCLQYQQLAKRYVPEVINYLLNALQMLSPQKPRKPFGSQPSHESPDELRIRLPASITEVPAPSFWLVADTTHNDPTSIEAKCSLLESAVRLVSAASALWTSQPSYPEQFEPFAVALQHLRSFKNPASTKSLLKTTSQTLQTRLATARAARTPLELHHHRPQAIKTAVPRFEETFRPGAHYDPDPTRREGARLRAEVRRERKGALRELRRDAAFVARESLAAKKVADRAYEDKFRRLVASIRTEEGREANAYDREKKARKRAK